MAKSRYYNVQYWNRACTKIDTDMSFDSKKECIQWLINHGFNILKVTYLGWR